MQTWTFYFRTVSASLRLRDTCSIQLKIPVALGKTLAGAVKLNNINTSDEYYCWNTGVTPPLARLRTSFLYQRMCICRVRKLAPMSSPPRSSPPVRAVKKGCGVSDSNRIWLNVECCGLTCASFTWAIVLFCSYAFVVRSCPLLMISALGVRIGGCVSDCSPSMSLYRAGRVQRRS